MVSFGSMNISIKSTGKLLLYIDKPLLYIDKPYIRKKDTKVQQIINGLASKHPGGISNFSSTGFTYSKSNIVYHSIKKPSYYFHD